MPLNLVEENQMSKSRPKRWEEACNSATIALEALKDLQDEYEEWRDNTPENAQSGEMYDKLEAICDLEIQSAMDTVNDASELDLPLGFGRD